MLNTDSKRIMDLLSDSSLSHRTKVEEQFRKKLALSSANIQYKNNIDFNLSPEISQVIPFEEPDLLIYSNNTLFAIEHFMIDASFTTKKGSTFKQKYNDKKSVLKEHQIDGLHTTRVSTPLNFKYLSSNFISCFTNHYSKIKNYKSKISSFISDTSTDIHNIFLIEYDVIFPSFIIKNDTTIFVFPDNDMQIINFLKNKDSLSGIICYFKGDGINFPDYSRLIDLSSDNLKDYQVDGTGIFDSNDIEIYDFENPVYSSITFTIPNDN